MRTAKKLSKEQQESLECLLGKVKSKADFQRVQCLWLRSALNLHSADVALAVGFSQSTVKIVQSRYLRDGEKALLGQGRGGKRYSNLTLEEEDSLLSSFLEKASAGGVLVVSEIKATYEAKVGKRVPSEANRNQEGELSRKDHS